MVLIVQAVGRSEHEQTVAMLDKKLSELKKSSKAREAMELRVFIERRKKRVCVHSALFALC